jgi:hypothetical protein
VSHLNRSPFKYEQSVAHDCASKNNAVQMPCWPERVKPGLRAEVENHIAAPRRRSGRTLEATVIVL